MNVLHSQNVGLGHSVEIGESTWDPTGERSIRDRWATANGGFSPRSSSEIPMDSLVHLLAFAAQHDELTAAQCSDIIVALAASIKRQHP